MGKEIKENQLQNIIITDELDVIELQSTKFNASNIISMTISGLDIQDFSFLNKFSRIEELFLKKLNITSSPIDDYMPNLKRLNLSHNIIKNLDFLKNCLYLERLYLDSNQIQDITPVSLIKNLRTLNLRNNFIHNIEPIKFLKNLERLYLSNNNISNIRIINNLKCLERLYLDNNPIEDLSPIYDLNRLKRLGLESCNIKDISFLHNFNSLTKLHLSNNHIENIKPLTSLLKIGVEIKSEVTPRSGIGIMNNPISLPPLEVVRHGNLAILNYFTELESGSAKLFEAKCIIVGKGGAGKTTLTRKIINADADMPLEEETTQGIDIQHYNFNLDNHKFRVNLWDFGGQEIYHSTHQFFFTKRSLYILVTNNREEDHDFEYWLPAVELLGGESPIFIVQNEKANRLVDIRIKTLKKQFLNLKKSISANLKLNIGLVEIKDSIEKYIKDLPHIGETLPVQWTLIRKELELKENKNISYI